MVGLGWVWGRVGLGWLRVVYGWFRVGLWLV